MKRLVGAPPGDGVETQPLGAGGVSGGVGSAALGPSEKLRRHGRRRAVEAAAGLQDAAVRVQHFDEDLLPLRHVDRAEQAVRLRRRRVSRAQIPGRLLGPVAVQLVGQRRIGEGQDLDGEQSRIAGPGVADGHGGHRHPARHLHDR